MSVATREETQSIKRFLIFSFLPFVLAILFSFMLVSKNNDLSDKLKGYEKEILKIRKKYGNIPSGKRLLSEKEYLKKLEDMRDILKEHAIVSLIEPPEEVIERGVYFKKQLFIAYKDLRRVAAKNNAGFCESLGFGEALPSYEEVPLLLRKLESVRSGVNEMLEGGIGKIRRIKLLDDEEYEDSISKRLIKIRYKVDFESSVESIPKVLFRLGNLKPFMVVDDISLSHMNGNKVEGSLVFSRLVSRGELNE